MPPRRSQPHRHAPLAATPPTPEVVAADAILDLSNSVSSPATPSASPPPSLRRPYSLVTPQQRTNPRRKRRKVGTYHDPTPPSSSDPPLSHPVPASPPTRRTARNRTSPSRSPPLILRLFDESTATLHHAPYPLSDAIVLISASSSLAPYVGQDIPHFPRSVFASICTPGDYDCWQAHLSLAPDSRRVPLYDPRRHRLLPFARSPRLSELRAILSDAERAARGNSLRPFHAALTVSLRDDLLADFIATAPPASAPPPQSLVAPSAPHLSHPHPLSPDSPVYEEIFGEASEEEVLQFSLANPGTSSPPPTTHRPNPLPPPLPAPDPMRWPRFSQSRLSDTDSDVSLFDNVPPLSPLAPSSNRVQSAESPVLSDGEIPEVHPLPPQSHQLLSQPALPATIHPPPNHLQLPRADPGHPAQPPSTRQNSTVGTELPVDKTAQLALSNRLPPVRPPTTSVTRPSVNSAQNPVQAVRKQTPIPSAPSTSTRAGQQGCKSTVDTCSVAPHTSASGKSAVRPTRGASAITASVAAPASAVGKSVARPERDKATCPRSVPSAVPAVGKNSVRQAREATVNASSVATSATAGRKSAVRPAHDTHTNLRSVPSATPALKKSTVQPRESTVNLRSASSSPAAKRKGRPVRGRPLNLRSVASAPPVVERSADQRTRKSTVDVRPTTSSASVLGKSADRTTRDSNINLRSTTPAPPTVGKSTVHPARKTAVNLRSAASVATSVDKSGVQPARDSTVNVRPVAVSSSDVENDESRTTKHISEAPHLKDDNVAPLASSTRRSRSHSQSSYARQPGAPSDEAVMVKGRNSGRPGNQTTTVVKPTGPDNVSMEALRIRALHNERQDFPAIGVDLTGQKGGSTNISKFAGSGVAGTHAPSNDLEEGEILETPRNGDAPVMSFDVSQQMDSAMMATAAAAKELRRENAPMDAHLGNVQAASHLPVQPLPPQSSHQREPQDGGDISAQTKERTPVQTGRPDIPRPALSHGKAFSTKRTPPRKKALATTPESSERDRIGCSLQAIVNARTTSQGPISEEGIRKSPQGKGPPASFVKSISKKVQTTSQAGDGKELTTQRQRPESVELAATILMEVFTASMVQAEENELSRKRLETQHGSEGRGHSVSVRCGPAGNVTALVDINIEAGPSRQQRHSSTLHQSALENARSTRLTSAPVSAQEPSSVAPELRYPLKLQGRASPARPITQAPTTKEIWRQPLVPNNMKQVGTRGHPSTTEGTERITRSNVQIQQGRVSPNQERGSTISKTERFSLRSQLPQGDVVSPTSKKVNVQSPQKPQRSSPSGNSTGSSARVRPRLTRQVAVPGNVPSTTATPTVARSLPGPKLPNLSPAQGATKQERRPFSSPVTTGRAKAVQTRSRVAVSPGKSNSTPSMAKGKETQLESRRQEQEIGKKTRSLHSSSVESRKASIHKGTSIPKSDGMDMTSAPIKDAQTGTKDVQAVAVERNSNSKVSLVEKPLEIVDNDQIRDQGQRPSQTGGHSAFASRSQGLKTPPGEREIILWDQGKGCKVQGPVPVSKVCSILDGKDGALTQLFVYDGQDFKMDKSKNAQKCRVSESDVLKWASRDSVPMRSRKVRVWDTATGGLRTYHQSPSLKFLSSWLIKWPQCDIFDPAVLYSLPEPTPNIPTTPLRRRFKVKVIRLRHRMRGARIFELTEKDLGSIPLWNTALRKKERVRRFRTRAQLTRFLINSPSLDVLWEQADLVRLERKAGLYLIPLLGHCPAGYACFWDPNSRIKHERPKNKHFFHKKTIAECFHANPSLQPYLGQDLPCAPLIRKALDGLKRSGRCPYIHVLMPCAPSIQELVFGNGWTPSFIDVTTAPASEVLFWDCLKRSIVPAEISTLASVEEFLKTRDDTLQLYAGQDMPDPVRRKLESWFSLLRYSPGHLQEREWPVLKRTLGYPYEDSSDVESVKTEDRIQPTRRTVENAHVNGPSNGHTPVSRKRKRSAANFSKALGSQDSSTSEDFEGSEVSNPAEQNGAALLHANPDPDEAIIEEAEGSSRRFGLVHLPMDETDEESECPEDMTGDPLWKPKKRVKRMLQLIKEAGPRILRRELNSDLRQALREDLILEVQSVAELQALVQEMELHDHTTVAAELIGVLEEVDSHGCFCDVDEGGHGPPGLSSLRIELERGLVCTVRDAARRFEEICVEQIEFHRGRVLHFPAKLLLHHGRCAIKQFLAKHKKLLASEAQMKRMIKICERGNRIGFVKAPSRRRAHASEKLKRSQAGSLHVSGCEPEVTYMNYRDEKGHSVMGKQQSVRVLGMSIDLRAAEQRLGHVRPCHVCKRELRVSVGDALICCNNVYGVCNRMVCCQCLERTCGIDLSEFMELRSAEQWTCIHCRGLCPIGNSCYEEDEVNTARRFQEKRQVQMSWVSSADELNIRVKRRRLNGDFEDEDEITVRLQKKPDGSQVALTSLPVGFYRCKVEENGVWTASTTFYLLPKSKSASEKADDEASKASGALIGKAWVAQQKLRGHRRIGWDMAVETTRGPVHSFCEKEGGKLIEGCSRTEGYDWRRAKRHSITRWIPERHGSPESEVRNETEPVEVEFCTGNAHKVAVLDNRMMPSAGDGVKHVDLMIEWNTYMYEVMVQKSRWGIVTGCSEIHGIGLFTLTGYAKGDFVIEYAGDVIRTPLGDTREREYEAAGLGTYLFKLNEDHIVDATVKSNRARFTNHSCDPNMKADVIKIGGRELVVLRAIRTIAKYAELTFDYKLPYEDKKLQCLCNATNCVGVLN